MLKNVVSVSELEEMRENAPKTQDLEAEEIVQVLFGPGSMYFFKTAKYLLTLFVVCVCTLYHFCKMEEKGGNHVQGVSKNIGMQ